MFWHNFKYILKVLFKNKMLIFWTFAFPLVLGTFFKMAFSNIEDSEKLDIIDIAIVDDENFQNNQLFKESFKVLSDEDNKERLFNTSYVDMNKAKEMLNDKLIVGYVYFSPEAKIVIACNGIEETVLKYVTEEINQTNIILNNTIKREMEQNNFVDYGAIYNQVLKMTSQNTANIKDISSNNLSYTMIEFYTLIAMACMYGGILGLFAINQVLADISSNGKRVAVSAISKKKLLISSLLASYLTQLIGLALLFFYTIFVLNVTFGNNLFFIILLAIAGSFTGLSLGVFVGSIFKTNENTKNGIIISLTMLGCFLSGMMGITMKYIIDKNVPLINKLNPVNMITDGFYSLYYYDTMTRYYFNLGSLIICSSLLLIISIFVLRRQKYDSI